MKKAASLLDGSRNNGLMDAIERARKASMAAARSEGHGAERSRKAEEARRRRREAAVPPRFQNERLEDHPREIAEWLDGAKAGNPANLVIVGPSGAGKTRAAASAVLAACDEVSARFLRSNDLMSELKETFGGAGSERGVISRYSLPRVLCLDDFGKQRATPYATEAAFNILDNRYCKKLPTIVTMQYDAEGLGRKLMREGADQETAEAVVRRIFDGAAVVRMGRR